MDRNRDQATRLDLDTWRWWHGIEQLQQTGSEAPSWGAGQQAELRVSGGPRKKRWGEHPSSLLVEEGGRGERVHDLKTSVLLPAHFIALTKTLTVHFIQSNLISLVCLFFIPTPISLMPEQPPTYHLPSQELAFLYNCTYHLVSPIKWKWNNYTSFPKAHLLNPKCPCVAIHDERSLIDWFSLKELHEITH